MKWLIIFTLIFITTAFLTSQTQKNDILIKYSGSENNFSLMAVNPPGSNNIKSMKTITAFCNNMNNNLKIEIYARIGFLKILSIDSKTNSYIEINYDRENNSLFLDSLLGQFDITSQNSHIDTVTRIQNIEINNYASNYRIISYPDRNIYIKVTEGKINVKKGKESILLVTGESCEISDEHINLSEIYDPNTSLIIMNTRLFSRYEKILNENKNIIDMYSKGNLIKNEKDLDMVKFNSLESIFSKSMIQTAEFGKEIENAITNDSKFWNGLLKTYPVNH